MKQQEKGEQAECGSLRRKMTGDGVSRLSKQLTHLQRDMPVYEHFYRVLKLTILL